MKEEGVGKVGAGQVFEVGSGSRMMYAGVYGEGGVAKRKTKGENKNEGIAI